MTRVEKVFDALDRRLDPGGAAPFAIGLSGGSDSTALLFCAREWARRTGRPLLALTVDHGLHPDSAAWTAAAGRLATGIGVRWRPLRWDGAKPKTGLPAAARAARHALLAEATREAGAVTLLLGHTADDIAESALIRCETPTHGWLQAWSPSPAWPQGRGVFLLRPLLALRRSELRAWLMAQGVGWLEDPANADLRFARPRARLALVGCATGNSSCASARSVAPRAVAPIVRIAEAWGGLEMERGALLAAEDPEAVLGRALLCTSGGQRPAGRAAVARAMEAVTGRGPSRIVLGGARLAMSDERLRLSRELGRSPPSTVGLATTDAQVFDGRFELHGHAPGWTVRLLAGSAARLEKLERERLRALAPEVRASLPLLCGPRGEVRLPAPLGQGPARMRSLVGPRLEAALGGVQDEAAAVRLILAGEAHGGMCKAVLSCSAEISRFTPSGGGAPPGVVSHAVTGPEGRP